MAWLPDGGNISKISLVVLAQLTNVTDGRTDRRTDGHRMPSIAALCIASHGKNFGVGLLGTSRDTVCYILLSLVNSPGGLFAVQ